MKSKIYIPTYLYIYLFTSELIIALAWFDGLIGSAEFIDIFRKAHAPSIILKLLDLTWKLIILGLVSNPSIAVWNNMDCAKAFIFLQATKRKR